MIASRDCLPDCLPDCLLPNLIVVSLTRAAVQEATSHHVSAADIQAFLERNAHPRMAAQVMAFPDCSP